VFLLRRKERSKATELTEHPAACLCVGRMLLDELLIYFGELVCWDKLVQNALASDFSWDYTAAGYEKIYKQLRKIK
jgi:glycogen synthase